MLSQVLRSILNKASISHPSSCDFLYVMRPTAVSFQSFISVLLVRLFQGPATSRWERLLLASWFPLTQVIAHVEVFSQACSGCDVAAS